MPRPPSTLPDLSVWDVEVRSTDRAVSLRAVGVTVIEYRDVPVLHGMTPEALADLLCSIALCEIASIEAVRNLSTDNLEG